MDLAWDKSYETGILTIDRQHQYLFSLIRRLHEGVADGKGHVVVEEVVAELHAYVAYHFSTEERLFAQYGYEGAEEHKREHEHFRKEVERITGELLASKGEAALKALALLKDWTHDHVGGADQEYVGFLREKGAT